MSDEIIGHTEHLLSAHSTREAIAQLEEENERLRKLLSDTNTYYAECIAEREDLRAEIRAYKRKVLSPFFKNSDMSEDEAIAYQVSVGNMRIRLHKQADEIERLRNALTRERTHWVEAMDNAFTQEQSDLYKAIWDKKNELDKNND